ncbi:MAG: MalY/PatB family protein [Chloroflexota bacterium]
MKYDFDTLPERRGSDCAKWDIPEADVLPMWVADMDFTSPPEVIAALEEHLKLGVFGYPNFGEKPNQAVVEWLEKRHQWQITPEAVKFVSGVVTGFNQAAHAVARPGEGYLVQTPTYGPFFGVKDNVGLTQQEMELTRDADGSYLVDLDAFEAAITPETRIFMLCNPQNPTGRVFTKVELEGMAEICLRHEVIICSDEIHSDLVYGGYKHIPVASLSKEIADITITLIAPSKTFNVAGLKASAAIITNEELRTRFEGAAQGLADRWVNMMGMVALQAAYREGAPWLDALLKYLVANRDYAVEFINQQMPGVSVAVPEGTFLAWLDCRELFTKVEPGESVKFNSFFEQQARVALNNGDWFGKGGEGFVRLNFGCPRHILKEGLTRLQGALERL